ncbi:hypothetical protein EDB62_10231 [Vibrio crassostreae]|nr:hypothetical protein EDB62_10231 [Vibrio crassostreae]TWD72620.1 hypothetical protein FB445_10231 [Vibrio crassostreae]
MYWAFFVSIVRLCLILVHSYRRCTSMKHSYMIAMHAIGVNGFLVPLIQ